MDILTLKKSQKYTDRIGVVGIISEGDNLNNYTENGIYQINGAVSGGPPGAGTPAILIVTSIPSEMASTGYFKQEYYDASRLGETTKYVRTGRKLYNNGLWYKEFISRDSSIGRTLLSNTFATNGLIPDNTNLNTLLNEGHYLGVASYAYDNCPFVGTNFILTVECGTERWIYQTAQLERTGITYTRRLDATNIIDEPWMISGVGTHKTLICFGDSITEARNSVVDYPRFIKRVFTAEVYNAGFGGCRMAQHSNEYYDKFSMYQLANAIASGDFSAQDNAAQILQDSYNHNVWGSLNRIKNVDFTKVTNATIFYGTNDFTASVPIGTDADIDGTTFKGAINHTVSTLLNAYPNIELTFITPIFRKTIPGTTENSDTFVNNAGHTLRDYRNAIVELAEKHHIGCIDLYSDSCINQYTADYYLSDGTHPNDTGYEYLGEKIGRFLKAK